MRMSVDFPAPFSPSGACTVAGRTCSDADVSARVAPNRLSMSRSASAGGPPPLEGSIMARGSETGRCGDEAPWNTEGAFDLLAQRSNAERLGGVVSGVENRDPELH